MGSGYMRFEDLEIWQEAMKLCKEVYAALRDCRDYGLKEQACKSAVSVPSNIAEGYERRRVHFKLSQARKFLFGCEDGVLKVF